MIGDNDDGVPNRSYIRVRWVHDLAGEPIDLWSELDEARFETRKLEYFSDGSVGYADSDEEVGDTGLSTEPIPSLDEIAKDPQFEPEVISRSEFEEQWGGRKSLSRPNGH